MLKNSISMTSNQRIQSEHISSWKGPIRIIESNSLLLAGLPKSKPYG